MHSAVKKIRGSLLYMRKSSQGNRSCPNFSKFCGHVLKITHFGPSKISRLLVRFYMYELLGKSDGIHYTALTPDNVIRKIGDNWWQLSSTISPSAASQILYNYHFISRFLSVLLISFSFSFSSIFSFSYRLFFHHAVFALMTVLL